MPIYKGATKVTPKPGGKALSRVYRGDRLVWTSSPYPLAGQWTAEVTATVKTYASHVIVESGTFTLTHTAEPAAGIMTYILTPQGSHLSGVTLALQVGDLIEFIASNWQAAKVVTGSWSIVKN